MKFLYLLLIMIISCASHANNKFLTCESFGHIGEKESFTFIFNEEKKVLYSKELSVNLQISKLNSIKLMAQINSVGTYNAKKYNNIDYSFDRISGLMQVVYTKKANEDCNLKKDKDCDFVAVIKQREAQCTSVSAGA